MIPGIEIGTRIGTLRIRAPGPARESVATSCPAVLRALSLEPPAMATHEILCVRALADPLPGGIDVRSRQAQMRPLAWESAMRASLREARRRAVRPIHGPVPATADAVLFADAAELLACAARDACRGSLTWFWWWRHLVPGTSFDQIVDAWRRAPEYAPAAFELLAATGAAMDFTRRLAPVQAAMLVDGVLRSYALTPLADAIASVWRIPRAAADRAPTLGHPERHTRPRDDADTPFAPPWRGIVSAEWDCAELGVEARTWAAIALVLRRAPWLARRAAFTPAVVTYLSSQAQLRTASSAADTASEVAINGGTAPLPTPRVEVNTEASGRRVDATHTSAPEKRSGATPRATEGEAVAQSEERRISARTADVTDRHSPVAPATPPAPAVKSFRPTPEITQPSDIGDAGLARPVQDVDACPLTFAPDVRVDSAYAGAFFLLNVAIGLELYSHGLVVCDEIDLGLWDFVELVALDILGEKDRSDSLWPVLHELADPAQVEAATRGAVSADPLCRRTRAGDLTHAERDALLARVRDHLRLLIKVEDPGSFLIGRRGSIGRSPGRLDVHFSLERHPIEIRLARLDRNPGWIPSAGVQVAFHFD
jgi:hypothetical protein